MKLRDLMIILILLSPAFAHQALAQKNSMSCSELSKISITPNFLDARGSDGSVTTPAGVIWTALYRAWFKNCFDLAKKYLDAGADPNYGGQWGAMAAVLVSDWPHKNIEINKKWIDLLLPYGLNWDKEGKNYVKPDYVLSEFSKSADYPQLIDYIKNYRKQQVVTSPSPAKSDPHQNGNAAANDGFIAPISGVYTKYINDDQYAILGAPTSELKGYFTDNVVNLFIRDKKEAKGEICRLNFDIFIGGQDGTSKRMPEITVDFQNPSMVTVTARKVNDIDDKISVRFSLERTPAGWRIGNMWWSNSNVSLLDILRKPTC